MNRKPGLIVLFLLVAVMHLVAQYSICECCANHAFLQEYEKIFPPEAIRAAGTKTIVFYTRVHQATDQIADSLPTTYREIEFRFNNRGYVSEIIYYRNMGMFHSKHKLARNLRTGKIRLTEFVFLDTSGKEMKTFPKSVVDYVYDKRNLLTKTKVRGLKGEILPDSLASYQQFEYDNLRRVIRSRNYIWYPTVESLDSKTETVFNDADFTSRSRLSTGPVLLMNSETSYNTDWKPVRQVDTDPATGESASEQNWTYGESGRLIHYVIRSFSGGSECPGGGNFEEIYTYADNGILLRVKHVFDENVCEISAEK